ncbi:MAG: alkaline phosphatase family protein [Anaerolineaceae bacterium]
MMKYDRTPARVVLIDISGLRQDVFHQALKEKKLPMMEQLLGGENAMNGVHIDPISTFPSTTFSAQTSIITGLHPNQHGISGNQFFDRFGSNNNGIPIFYDLDMGDRLAVDDAVAVFQGKKGLIGDLLEDHSLTIYEIAKQFGLRSIVGNHMLARGADLWLKPELMDVARFTKAGDLFGSQASAFDHQMIQQLCKNISGEKEFDFITAYFMGLDHQSHHEGPESQMDYLSKVIDAQVGELVETLRTKNRLTNTLFVFVSDHGQVACKADDRYAIPLSYPFEREFEGFFSTFGLDMQADFPGEGPNCEAVVASNGGMAQVYLQNRRGSWKDAPRFELDVLPIAEALWEANLSGMYCSELRGTLSMILVRNVEQEGWQAPYQVLTADGIFPLDEYFEENYNFNQVEGALRLNDLSGHTSGDLILISDIEEGYYFGSPVRGVHGGLKEEESFAVLSLGWFEAKEGSANWLRNTTQRIIARRRELEKRSSPLLEDMLPVLWAVMGWG